MSVFLALESSCNACSVALRDGEGKIISRHADMARGQSEQIFLMLQECIEEYGSDNFAPDKIIVSKGPGAFTGIRIGLSAARGLGLAYDCPVIGLSTMDIMMQAMRADIQASHKPCLVAMETKRTDFYLAAYTATGEAIAPAFTALPEQLEETLPCELRADAFLVLGDAAGRACQHLQALGLSAVCPDWNREQPTATSLIVFYDHLVAAGVDFSQSVYLPQANYIRPPDAAISKKEKREIASRDLDQLLS